MARKIFVNLPVADVAVSTAFYEAVGGTRNPIFSDATTSCIVFSETIYFMLLEHDRFRTFTTKAIADARTSTEVLTAIFVDERDEVDATLAAALAAGGTEDETAAQDFGFMYGRRFEDPDGHSVDIGWMDMDAAATAMQPDAAAA